MDSDWKISPWTTWPHTELSELWLQGLGFLNYTKKAVLMVLPLEPLLKCCKTKQAWSNWLPKPAHVKDLWTLLSVTKPGGVISPAKPAARPERLGWYLVKTSKHVCTCPKSQTIQTWPAAGYKKIWHFCWKGQRKKRLLIQKRLIQKLPVIATWKSCYKGSAQNRKYLIEFKLHRTTAGVPSQGAGL